MTLPPLDDALEEQLDRAAEALSDADTVSVASHVNPDGDALGSILAIAHAFRAMGKAVSAGWGEESFVVPTQYAFLPGTDGLLVPPDRFPSSTVAMAVDCATPERLGCLRERITGAEVLVNIDHHPSNTRFGTVDVIDERAPSSSDLVLRLLQRMGAEITLPIAVCLYTGLVTDTGRFSYRSVDARAHAVAGYLIDKGIAVDEVSQAVFESLPYGYLRILGRILERCRLLDDPPLVISYMSQRDLAECGVSLDETEEVINVLRMVRESDVAAILKELDDGRWKGSLRSKGDTDVGRAAQRLGGGGHRLAAGFELSEGLEDGIALVHRTLGDLD